MEFARTKKEAKTRGDRHYYTGVPCKRGHDALRYTSTAQCVECVKVHRDGWRAANPEKTLELARRDHYKRRDDNLRRMKEYRQRNPEYFREKSREYRATTDLN